MNKTVYEYAPRMYGHMTLRPKNKILSDDVSSIIAETKPLVDNEMTTLENESTVLDCDVTQYRDNEATSLMLPERDEVAYEEPECGICFEAI